LSSGKTSRFYRALTDKNLTLNVSANTGYFHDPSLLNIYANLAPGATHEQVEKALLAEIDLVKTAGVTAAEVATALGKIKAATAYKRDGYFSIAGNLNEDIAAGDWTLYYTLDSAIAKVTTADVARVANLYLDLNQSVTGWFIPLTPPAAK
jgi:zinc protease